MKKKSKFITIALLLGASAIAAQAATNGFIVPAFRGSPNSQAGYWETFTVPVGAPGNLPDRPGSTATAVLTQWDTNAFLTGSGNLYNLSGTSVFQIVGTTAFPLGALVLQTRSLGGELDYTSPSLAYTNDTGLHTVAPRARVELNRGNQPGLGATVSSLWQWDLSGLGLTSYTIHFQAGDTSLSFDSLTLDAWDQFAPLFTAPVKLNSAAPSIERWMYANNGAPCDRPAGSTFGTLDETAGVDLRHAQHLIGWNTASAFTTNRGATQYLVQRCRLTLTINRGNLFVYDPTSDDLRTYLPTNHPNYLPDADAGRPVELFGAGYRNGFDAGSFDQCSPFGSNAPGQRNAYAASYSTNGTLVDVSNNVGRTNEGFPPFEAMPFAVGQTINVAPGQLVPAGAKITFDLDLSNPFVLGYVQAGLNAGQLRFMVSSLHTTAGQFGTPSYPDFATHFNDAVVEPTRLELDAVVAGSGDVDADGLSDDWELFYLHTLTYAAADDPDGDGAANRVEFRAGTAPQDGGSALRITSFAPAPGGGSTLQFPHSANRHYGIEISDDLTAWSRVTNASLIFPSRATAQWTDDGSLTGGNSPKRFYRVTVEQP